MRRNADFIKVIAYLFLCLLTSVNYSHGQDKLYSNAFPLGDVKLLEGPFRHARDLNIKVLLEYDADRLIAGYRKQAGLPEKANSFSNWEGLDGHVGGHYLSALAMNYSATRDAACKKRLDYLVSELKACQRTHSVKHPDWGKGYLGAIPNSEKIWSTFRNGDFAAYRQAWVPWYNIHKMYAGLRDAWLYAGNTEARELFLNFCNWGISITALLTDEQMQSMLDTEHGGMNEIFADAYKMTGDDRFLSAAKRFSHKMLLEPMSESKDNLDNKHANTQVPKAVGFQRIGELADDDSYTKAGDFFWRTVTTNRSLAFGGNSRREFFAAISAAQDFVNDVEGPETCNSYNMLKLTEGLFRVNPLAKYADYYERTLYNHILSTQHPGHGGYVYFTPARPRHYRVYSAPNKSMWCCVGSGMENHGKYNQFIYTHEKNALYVNLFVASELNWRDKKVKIKQATRFPEEERTRISITEGASTFSLKIRYPGWVKEGTLKVSVNGRQIPVTKSPSSYISITRLWKKGDVVVIQLPMQNSIEQLHHVPNYIAVLHGPILLAARSGTEDLKGLVADDGRWSHIAGGTKLPLDKAPIILEDTVDSFAGKLRPVKDHPLTFSLENAKLINPVNTVFEPFYKIHDARYMLYWMALSNDGYRSYLDSLAAMEQQKLALQKRTVDFVAPGEQQPEADHSMEKHNSNTGNQHGDFWRDAYNEGHFSYQLSTKNETGLSLLVKYWGTEWGNRKFDIYIDDQKLISENNTGRWNQSRFFELEYSIPDAMIKGKSSIRVKFQAVPGNTAGAVYYVRLLRKE